MPILNNVLVKKNVARITNLTTTIKWKTDFKDGIYPKQTFEDALSKDIDASEFPPELYKKDKFTKIGTVASSDLKMYSKFTWRGEFKENLQAIRLDIYTLSMVAVDGAVMKSIMNKKMYTNKYILLPNEAVDIITLSKTEKIKISHSEEFIKFTSKEFEIISNKIVDVEFPEFKKVWPTLKDRKIVKVDRQKLLNDIKFLDKKILPSQNGRRYIIFRKNYAGIMNKSDIRVKIKLSTKLSESSFAVDSRCMITTLESFQDEIVQFAMPENNLESIVINKENILMPLRIEADSVLTKYELIDNKKILKKTKDSALVSLQKENAELIKKINILERKLK